MKLQKQLFSSGAKWEDIVGYSRAVKAGNVIEISGTTAVDGVEIIGKGDVYAQAVFIFQKIEKVLQEARCNTHQDVRYGYFQMGRCRQSTCAFL